MYVRWDPSTQSWWPGVTAWEWEGTGTRHSLLRATWWTSTRDKSRVLHYFPLPLTHSRTPPFLILTAWLEWKWSQRCARQFSKFFPPMTKKNDKNDKNFVLEDLHDSWHFKTFETKSQKKNLKVFFLFAECHVRTDMSNVNGPSLCGERDEMEYCIAHFPLSLAGNNRKIPWDLRGWVGDLSVRREGIQLLCLVFRRWTANASYSLSTLIFCWDVMFEIFLGRWERLRIEWILDVSMCRVRGTWE